MSGLSRTDCGAGARLPAAGADALARQGQAAIAAHERGKRLYARVLIALRKLLGHRICSSDTRSPGAGKVWRSISEAVYDAAENRYCINPKLGNTGQEFIQHAKLRVLQQQIWKDKEQWVPLETLREMILKMAKDAEHQGRYGHFRVIEGGKRRMMSNPGPGLKKTFVLKTFLGPVYRFSGKGLRHRGRSQCDGVGGYHRRAGYAFIPGDEIWIEKMADGVTEERYLLGHEMMEILVMRVLKWGYQKAHDAITPFELRLRKEESPQKVFRAYIAKFFPKATPTGAHAALDGLMHGYRSYR